jgi:hypothetical protein
MVNAPSLHRVSCLLLVVISLSGALSCATVRSGEYGVPLAANSAAPAQSKTGLKISATELNDLSSPFLGAVEVTFENDSPAWVQIDRVDLDFGTPQKNQSVFLPWGAEIDSWDRAVAQRNAIRTVNAQSGLALMALSGSVLRVAGAAGHGRAVTNAGGILAAGALIGALQQDLTDSQRDAERVATFPENHLLNVPIRIPPGLFAKRWLLLYTAARPLGGCIDSVILGFETANAGRERVLLKFKDSYTEWQKLSCSGSRSVELGRD